MIPSGIVAITPGDRDPASVLDALAAAGLNAAILREPHLSAAALRALAERARLHVILHDSHAAAAGLARELGLTLHLPARSWRPGPYGVSCHDAAEVDRAFEGGALYALLSPVWQTSKPDDPRVTLGPDRFVEIAAGRPVLALGGVTPSRWHRLRARGAHGAAVMSGLFAAADPVAALRAYQNGYRVSS